jgi:hypothetical protein
MGQTNTDTADYLPSQGTPTSDSKPMFKTEKLDQLNRGNIRRSKDLLPMPQYTTEELLAQYKNWTTLLAPSLSMEADLNNFVSEPIPNFSV